MKRPFIDFRRDPNRLLVPQSFSLLTLSRKHLSIAKIAQLHRIILINYFLLCLYISVNCKPACSNGGTCSFEGKCQCTRSWNGSACTIRKSLIVHGRIVIVTCNHFDSLAICKNACRNGGTCSSPDVCQCATGWTGSLCETCKYNYFSVLLGVILT